MKTLTKVFLFFLIPLCVSSQTNRFRSNLHKQFTDVFTDTTIRVATTNQQLRIDSRFFGASLLSNKDEVYSTYLLGLSLEANISNKLMLIAFYDYLDGNHTLAIKNYQDSLGIYYPGFGLQHNRVQFNAKYLANKFITVDIGHGKQFIGDGYQSLLLSDVASSYPYLNLTTEFGPVKYYNLYTTFLNPEMVDYGRKKHATIHYLDFAITQKIHFGLFESILWQSKSEGENRGYELAYFNPVIFYRPVEFSKQSHVANALIGASLNITFQNTIFYGQFMLDDLNISRQKDVDDNYEGGFFQNKYGYQLGLKGEIQDVKYLIEYNQVQPYTYGHRTILQNYSHMNQALAHPLGANFKELINILEIRKGKWTYKIKTIFTNVGLDSLNTHYGQNIFQSDYEASTGGQYSYGNFNGQGVSTTILSFQPEISFKLKGFDIFGLVYYRTKKSALLDQTSLLYLVGVRTFPFSTFQDY
ncbi:MAG: hypothetical protein VX762_02100 [Bacteroidota bacterium]|nr:hypothetical protein [Bacteroidota bacterium]